MNLLLPRYSEEMEPLKTPSTRGPRGGLLLALVALVAIMLLGTPVVAQAAAAAPNDALLHDAQEYAKAYGVSQDEAIRRLELQGPIGDLNAQLVTGESNSFAGLWIEHAPEYKVVVQFADDGEKRLDSLVAGGPLEKIVEKRSAAQPLAALEEQQLALTKAITDLGVPVESGINVAENKVRLYTTDPTRLTLTMQAARLQIDSNVEVVKVNSLTKPAADIYGGLVPSVCTLGFSVIDYGGTRGVTTAAHCNNAVSYLGSNLPYQWGTEWGDLDAQWHTAPGFNVVNKAHDALYDSSTPYYRLITGKKAWSQQVVNEWVCHYGRVTNYGCGSIVEVYMTASHLNPSGNRFIRVAASGVDLSSPGDSGGPWYSGQVAYGTMVGVQNDTQAIYMATNFVEELGLFILLN